MEGNGCKYCGFTAPASAVVRERSQASDGLCILHNLDEHKDLTLFNTLIQAKLDRGETKFSGFVFPAGAADFSGWHFENGADFSGAIFLSEASFRGAHFSGPAADFTGAEFHQGADFSEARFECGTAFFSKASFSGGKALFERAVFLADTTGFTDARFDTDADFQSTSFRGANVYFTECIFSGAKTDFSHSVFIAENLSFRWARFLRDANFAHTKFDCATANFEQCTFLGCAANFNEAGINGKTITFGKSRFSNGCNFNSARVNAAKIVFSRARFSGKTACFVGANFTCEDLDFSSASFLAQKTDFSEVSISGKQDFRHSTFSGNITTFAGVRFSDGKTMFDAVTFSIEQPVCFAGAQFNSPASFRGVKFQKGAAFSGSHFLAGADFGRADFKTTPGELIDFRSVRFGGSSISFQSVDLRNTAFSGFQLDGEMHANGARWPSRRYFLHLRRRHTCADERMARTPAEYRLTAQSLRIFEQAMRKSGATRLAGDFAFSAFECKRKARVAYSPLRYLELILGAWTSGYGQKMWNLFFFSLLIIAGCALVLTVMGEGVLKPPYAGDAAVAGSNDPSLLSHFGVCLGRSIAAFLTAGLLKIQSFTPRGNLVLRLEGLVGMLVFATFFALLMRRLLHSYKMNKRIKQAGHLV